MHLVAPHPVVGTGFPLGVVDLIARLAAHHLATYDHAFAVAGLSRSLAWELGIDPTAREEVVLGGLVHDIGKLSLDETMLDSPYALTPIERERVLRHPSRGARLLRRHGEFRLASVVEQYHERFDGSGQKGLRGKNILLAARVVAVANAFDGLVTGRPYRPALSIKGALRTVAARSGTWYDPDVVGALHRRENGVGLRMPFLSAYR
jgi:putative nucleotidyltransferase with HDIG domain